MKTIKRTFCLMLTLAAVAVFAQPPRGYFPWWDSPLARDLNLSEEQRKQVREVVRDYRNKLIDARSAVEKAEGDVEDLFNEDQIDTRRTGEAVEKLAAARADLTRVFAQMSLKLRTILTPQQWQELRKRRAEKPRLKQGLQPKQPQTGERPLRPNRLGRRQVPRQGQPQQAQPPQPAKPPADEGSGSLD
jgi:Spy/CpxP family protein refolding chaperone